MIDYALLMYNISEKEILTQWSIGTLVKKVRHGFNFEVLKKGGKVADENENENLMTRDEVELLENLYNE